MFHITSKYFCISTINHLSDEAHIYNKGFSYVIPDGIAVPWHENHKNIRKLLLEINLKNLHSIFSDLWLKEIT